MTYLQFKTKPYTHQLNVLEHSKDMEFYMLAHEMGLGKSKQCLDLAAYLYNDKKIQQLLLITKNGVHKQFVEEAIPQHLPLLENQYIAEIWRADSHKFKVWAKYGGNLQGRLHIASINCEALASKATQKVLLQYVKTAPTLLVVDESHEFAGIKSLRTKFLLQIAPHCSYRRLMTGTPTGGNPCHLYPQLLALSPTILNQSQWSFEATYCIKQAQKIWVKDRKTGLPTARNIMATVGYKNEKLLEEKIRPYVSRLTKAECLDLPDKIYKTVNFELSSEERELYNRIKRGTLVELQAGQYIAADMPIKKLLRLLQVTCGFAVFEDLITGERGKSLLANPSRLKTFEDLSEQVTGKAIVWASFTTCVDQLVELLGKKYGAGSVARYDGTMSSAQKSESKHRFKETHETKWLVGHPRAGGTGLDLPGASTTFYYNNDPNLITRLQSEDRNHRIGSKENVTYIDLVAHGTVEDRYVKALKDKFDVAAKLNGDTLREWLQ